MHRIQPLMIAIEHSQTCPLPQNMKSTNCPAHTCTQPPRLFRYSGGRTLYAALLAMTLLLFLCPRAWSGDPDDPYEEPKLAYSIPYSRLIHHAAGVSSDMEKNKAPDPKAPIPPALLAAYKNRIEKDGAVAEYRAALAAYDAANSYASSMAATAAALAPTYDLGNGRGVAVTGISVPTRPVCPNPKAEALAEQADNAYREAYIRYGDPSGRLPLPDNYTPDHRRLLTISPVGVTADNRVLAVTVGGTNRDIPRRLWLVDTSSAKVVLQTGSIVHKNGQEFGELVSFEVAQADPTGRVLLRARLKDSSRNNPNEPVLVLWTERDGPQLIAVPGDVSNDGQNQPVTYITKYLMGPNGDVAIYCPRSTGYKTENKTSRVFICSPGQLQLAAIGWPPESTQPPSDADPQPTRRRVSNRMHSRFQIGAQIVELDPSVDSLDLGAMKWLPDGEIAFFGTQARVAGGMNHLWGRVWTYLPQTGVVANFDSGEADTTWFGPEHTVAILDARRGFGEEPRIVPTRLRAGSTGNVALLTDFYHAKLPGIGPDQSLAGCDPKGQMPLVALGPDHKIAFTAYLDGKGPARGLPLQRSSPPKRQFDPQGPFIPHQWVLVAGTIGDPNSLRIVADEAMISDANAGKIMIAGSFASLAFTSNGRLVFTTTGRPSAQFLHRNVEVAPALPHFFWSWDSAGLRRLAVFRATVDEPKGPRPKVRGFDFQLSGNNRGIMTCPGDGCVYISNVE